LLSQQSRVATLGARGGPGSAGIRPLPRA